MSILIGFFTVILVFLSLFLVLVVLMQRPKADSGLGAAIGGAGAAESAFGAETSNVLMRTTIVCAVAFFILSFGLYLGHMFLAHRAAADVRPLPDIPEEVEPGAVPEDGEEASEEAGEGVPEEIDESLVEPDPDADPVETIPDPEPMADPEESPPADPQ